MGLREGTATAAAGPRPSRRRWAGAALAALAVLAAGLVGFAPRYLGDLAAFGLGAALNAAVLAAAAWWAFTTRRAWKRRLNLAVATLAVALLLADVLWYSVGHAAGVLGLVVLLPAYALAARRALRQPGPARPWTPPARPWLLVNPRAGGGKAARLGLADAAMRRGVQVHLLEPGDDPAALARAAVAAGADAIGVAGGDGSLGLVAAVAMQLDVPFVCVPAGTRNHFAHDLGLDRAAPLAALDAFGGPERRVDAAAAGDRVFLNNVSLGAYAELVHEPGYRAGKLATAHAVLPGALRGEAAPLHLTLLDPDGRRHDDPLVLLVANNAYELRWPLALGARSRLDAGVLQVSALRATRGAALAALATRLLAGRGEPGTRWAQWTATSVRVDAPGARVPAGVDGEATELATPLRFRTLPRALRVLVPPAVPPAWPTERRLFSPATVRRLWAIARGAAGPGAPGPPPRPPETDAPPPAPRPRAGLGAALRRADLGLYRWLGGRHSPLLDRTMPALSRRADYARLWLGVAGVLVVAGPPSWRRAAVRGVASLALASASANLAGKLTVSRQRPPLGDVPADRRVRRVPVTTSFPSGHAASAAAFATGVALEAPGLALPVGALAAAVAVSRVWTGAHYPGDVVAGAALGAALAYLSRTLGTAAVP